MFYFSACRVRKYGQADEYASKYGQPGKYVRLKWVDVHTDSDRPAGANPKIRMVINASIWGYSTNMLFLQYSNHHQMLELKILKNIFGGRRGDSTTRRKS